MQIMQMMQMNKSSFDQAKDHAVRYLSYKPRTEEEVRIKLLRKKYGMDIIKNVIERLKELNYIDDDEYIKLWISVRCKVKPEGRIKIFYDLERKGISKEKIENTMEKLSYDEYSSALILARKKKDKILNTESKKEMKNIYSYFQRKGFRFETVDKVISTIRVIDFN